MFRPVTDGNACLNLQDLAKYFYFALIMKGTSCLRKTIHLKSAMKTGGGEGLFWFPFNGVVPCPA